MKKTIARLLTAFLLISLLSGCKVEKAKVNIDDYGDETRTSAETEAPTTTAAPTCA